MSQLRFHLLGASQINDENGQSVVFRSKKAKALLIYLAALAEQTHNRDQLMTLLYPGIPESSAAGNLRQLRYQVRQAVPAIAGKNGKGIDILLLDGVFVRINRAYPYELDVDVFNNRLATARALRKPDWRVNEEYRQQLEETAAAYGGPFLTDFYLDDSDPFESWAQSLRDRLRHDVLETLSHLADIALHRRDYEQAGRYAEEQLAADNLRENAYRQLMEALARRGQIGEALNQYEKCARVLRAEMSMAPSAKTTALYEQIRTGNLDGSQISQINVRGYNMGEKVAAGAFGEVYRASQPHIGRTVAVKVIRPQFANQPEFIRRFEAEARVVARLEHPFIVPLYDYWREPNGAYLVMRWFERGTLSAAMAGKPWPAAQILRLTDQLTGALAVAHRHGIVHRDLKPANVLLDADENAYLSDFGIAKDVFSEVNLTEASAVIGTPAYISPEQILNEPVSPQTDIYALGIILFELLTGQKPFPGASLPELMYKHLNEQLPAVSALQPTLPGSVDNVVWRMTAKQATDRFPDVLTLRQALHQALSDGPGPDLTEEPEWFDPRLRDMNPYRGLRAFQEGDADVFFGRSTLVEQLLARWQSPNPLGEAAVDRFMAVVGPSGSGKSSVVRAGLIPALRQGALPDSDKWFITAMEPGSHPFEELEVALRRVAVDAPDSLLEPLQKDDRGLVRVLRHILPDDGAGQPGRLLLIIDQFEELFTQVADDDRRRAFLDSLIAALSDRRGQLRVIVTIRADFYDRPLQYGPLGELLRLQTEVVLPLNPTELEEAIRVPALRGGVRLEEGLIATIAADVNEQPGALPLLQYMLTELYEKRRGDLMTHAAYHELGGVLGAIGRRAEELYLKLDAAGQAATRQVFLRLVILGEGVEDTRRRTLQAELMALADAESADLTERLIAAFGRHRLLTFDRDPITRGPTVEVAHEALLREWPRLRGWLDESRDDVRRQQRLAQGAAEWRAGAEDESLLLRGALLAQYEQWLETPPLALTPAERDYLARSVTARDERLAAEEARRQRELETARQLAATEKARAETETRRAQEQVRAAGRLRWLSASLAVIFLVAMAAALIAVQQWQISVERLDLSRSRELAGLAGDALITDPELAILLALEALETAYTPEGENLLHQAVLTSQIRQRFSTNVPRSDISEIAASPNGQFIAATGSASEEDPESRALYIWSASSGELIHKFPIKRYDGNIWPITFFNSDSRRVAVMGSGEMAALDIWDVISGELVQKFELPRPTDDLFSLVLNDDWSLLAVGYLDGTGSLWDMTTGEPILEFLASEDDVLGFSFSHDGQRLAVVDNSVATIWDVASGQALFTFTHGSRFGGHQTPRLSPDGRYLAVKSLRDVTIWDLEATSANPDEPVLQSALIGHRLLIMDQRFNEDGTKFITAARDQTARIWDPLTGEELVTISGGSNNTFSAALSPDEMFLYTGGFGDTLQKWDITATGTSELGALEIEPDGHIALSPDETRLAAVGSDNLISVWEIATMQRVITFTGHTLFVEEIAFSPDGTQIATASRDGTVIIWDAATGELLHQLDNYGEQVSLIGTGIMGLDYSPDGSRLATAGTDGNATIWDAHTGEELLVMYDSSGFFDVDFSADGTMLAGATDEPHATAVVWDVASGERIVTLPKTHGDRVRSLDFSPDGTFLATGGGDGKVRLWQIDAEAGTAELLVTLLGHTGTIFEVQFSPDGQMLASTSSLLKLWDLSSLYDENQTVTTLTSPRLSLASSANPIFSSDNSMLLHTSGSAIQFLALSLDELLELAQSRLTRTWTADECLLFRIESCAEE